LKNKNKNNKQQNFIYSSSLAKQTEHTTNSTELRRECKVFLLFSGLSALLWSHQILFQRRVVAVKAAAGVFEEDKDKGLPGVSYILWRIRLPPKTRMKMMRMKKCSK
jgi:hypothetical protein